VRLTSLYLGRRDAEAQRKQRKTSNGLRPIRQPRFIPVFCLFLCSLCVSAPLRWLFR
jgi:hypothetical protein